MRQSFTNEYSDLDYVISIAHVTPVKCAKHCHLKSLISDLLPSSVYLNACLIKIFNSKLLSVARP